MALYWTTSKETGALRIGQSGSIKAMHIRAKDILAVQADEDELAVINQNFGNIPFVKGERVVEWHGDFAKFIARNFPTGEK